MNIYKNVYMYMCVVYKMMLIKPTYIDTKIRQKLQLCQKFNTFIRSTFLIFKYKVRISSIEKGTLKVKVVK